MQVKNSSKSWQRSLWMVPKAIEYKWDIFDNCFKVCKDRNKASLYILTHPTGWCYYCNCKYFNDNSRRGGSSDKNSLTLSRKRNRNNMRVSKWYSFFFLLRFLENKWPDQLLSSFKRVRFKLVRFKVHRNKVTQKCT